MKNILLLAIAVSLLTTCTTKERKSRYEREDFSGIEIEIFPEDSIFVMSYRDTILHKTWREVYRIYYNDALVCEPDFLLERKIIIDNTPQIN